MLADHIRRHKAETNLELFNPDEKMKEDEVVKKVLMFKEQLENKEYYTQRSAVIDQKLPDQGN